MSNRKKMKDNSKRLKKDPSLLRRGLAKLSQPSNRPHIPTADEVFTAPDLAPEAMASDTPIIKVVPAKHKGATVGDAYIHEDGQVTVKFHEDAPQWALDEINQTAKEIGYSLEEGQYNGPS